MSIFSGIGGIELGLHATGRVTTVGFCEQWPVAQAVLRHRFPDVPLNHDVLALDNLSGADIVTAGFPCTDLSAAGKRLGLDGSASGLVLHLLDLVARDKPTHVLLENVPMMLHLHGGRAMATITDRLAQSGYSWAYRVMDSRSFGLPQRRRRVYLLASRNELSSEIMFRSEATGTRPDGGVMGAWSNAFGFYWTEGNRGLGWAVDAVPTLKGSTTVSIPSAPAVWLPDARPGARIVTPSIRSAERLQGFPGGWTEAAPERDRWKLVGNAVSVPAAKWIGDGLVSRGESLIDGLRIAPRREGTPWARAAFSDSGKIWNVDVSEMPLPPRGSERHLRTVLRRHGDRPLSVRATQGFRDRLVRSRLSYYEDFLQDLDAHIECLRRE